MGEKLFLTLLANATSSLSRFARVYVITMLGLGGAFASLMLAMGAHDHSVSFGGALALTAFFTVMAMFAAALPVAIVVGILFLAFAK
jgi:hypothetical protein